jgi:hypothetical protein
VRRTSALDVSRQQGSRPRCKAEFSAEPVQLGCAAVLSFVALAASAAACDFPVFLNSGSSYNHCYEFEAAYDSACYQVRAHSRQMSCWRRRSLCFTLPRQNIDIIVLSCVCGGVGGGGGCVARRVRRAMCGWCHIHAAVRIAVVPCAVGRQEWWAAHGYSFKGYASGQCGAQYNLVEAVGAFVFEHVRGAHFLLWFGCTGVLATVVLRRACSCLVWRSVGRVALAVTLPAVLAAADTICPGVTITKKGISVHAARHAVGVPVRHLHRRWPALLDADGNREHAVLLG